MFREKTAFILGAGASYHYNYPTGEQLVKAAIKKAQHLESFISQHIQTGFIDACWPSYIAEKYNYNKNHNMVHPQSRYELWEKTKSECKAFAQNLKHTNSLLIDYFLANNQELRGIGKLIVAWVILECETEYFSKGGNQNRIKILENSIIGSKQKEASDLKHQLRNNGCPDDWCRFILHKLVTGWQENEKLGNNQVTFVTFNYDVSLETILQRGLRSFGKELISDQEISDLFDEKNQRFLHVYGKICADVRESRAYLSLESPPNNNVEQANLLKMGHFQNWFDTAYEASKNLKLVGIHEKPENKETIEKAKQALLAAKNIFILGYGFDAENNKLLDLPQATAAHRVNNKFIYFTNYENRNAINKRASHLFFDRKDGFLDKYIRDLNDFHFSPSLASRRNYYEKSIRDAYQALERDFDFID
jgi:hypothetical protein